MKGIATSVTTHSSSDATLKAVAESLKTHPLTPIYVIASGESENEEFVSKVRDLGVSTKVLVFCKNMYLTRKWVTNYKDVQCTNNPKQVLEHVRNCL